MMKSKGDGGVGLDLPRYTNGLTAKGLQYPDSGGHR